MHDTDVRQLAYNAADFLVDRHVREGRGSSTAFIQPNCTYTYDNLATEVSLRQRALASLGLQSGDRVAMVVRDEIGFPVWFLGAMRGGYIAVPLSTMLTPTEVAAVIADSGATVVIVSATHVGHLAAIAEHAPLVREVVVLPDMSTLPGGLQFRVRPEAEVVTEEPLHTNPLAPATTTADTPAFWLYSSGTTGTPKGVMHRHESLQATADTYASSVLGFHPDDRVLSVAKLFFAFGLGNSLTFPLAFGASALLNPDPPTPPSIQSLLEAERPTLFFASPGFVAALLDAQTPPEAFTSVRLAVTAGEALPADLARRFTERFNVPILDGLGTTEALHIFLSNHIDDTQFGTSGKPVKGYEIDLRDENNEPVVASETPGFLHVRGRSIADGYWQRPDATAQAFVDGWLRTGDVYVRNEGGFFRFLGRSNDMIKAGGIWVSPAEVESVLIEHPDVLEAAVVGSRNSDGLETTVAFVVARTGCTIDPGAIDAYCRSRMAAFKRPRRVIVVEGLPKTATGKVQRFALRSTLQAQ